MLLKVPERLTLLGLLPPMEGNIVLLRMVRELQTQASFSPEETKALGLRRVGSQWLWGADQGKEIEIPEPVKVALVTSLEALSKQGKLNMARLGLYERFTGEKDAVPLPTKEQNGKNPGQNRAARRALDRSKE